MLSLGLTRTAVIVLTLTGIVGTVASLIDIARDFVMLLMSLGLLLVIHL